MPLCKDRETLQPIGCPLHILRPLQNLPSDFAILLMGQSAGQLGNLAVSSICLPLQTDKTQLPWRYQATALRHQRLHRPAQEGLLLFRQNAVHPHDGDGRQLPLPHPPQALSRGGAQLHLGIEVPHRPQHRGRGRKAMNRGRRTGAPLRPGPEGGGAGPGHAATPHRHADAHHRTAAHREGGARR